MKSAIKAAYQTASKTLSDFVAQTGTVKKTTHASQLIADAFKSKKKLLICGNGGSLCDAMHAAEEFTGRFRKNRPALPAIALADPSHITCVGNDFGFDEIFSRGIEALGQKNDILIVLSTSGNSENIIKAVNAAKTKKLKTIAFLGKGGGKLAGCCDIEFIIPAETSDRIQEVHMTILHIIIEGVERILFPKNYN